MTGDGRLHYLRKDHFLTLFLRLYPPHKGNDGTCGKLNEVYFVIPAKAKTQEFLKRSDKLVSRLQGNDDFYVVRYSKNQQGSTQWA